MGLASFPEIKTLIVFLLVAGLTLMLLSFRLIIKKKLFSSISVGFTGLSITLIAGFLISLTINLYTYQRLTNEQHVAELMFSKLSEQQYELSLIEMNGETHSLAVSGDEWQLDARVMKWSGLANLLGLDTLFRLERISGRFKDITQERNSSRTVYALSNKAGLDLWEISREYTGWFPWVDTIYGSATYLPMKHGAIFKVSLATSGLIARPANKIASDAVKNWR